MDFCLFFKCGLLWSELLMVKHWFWESVFLDFCHQRAQCFWCCWSSCRHDSSFNGDRLGLVNDLLGPQWQPNPHDFHKYVQFVERQRKEKRVTSVPCYAKSFGTLIGGGRICRDLNSFKVGGLAIVIRMWGSVMQEALKTWLGSLQSGSKQEESGSGMRIDPSCTMFSCADRSGCSVSSIQFRDLIRDPIWLSRSDSWSNSQ